MSFGSGGTTLPNLFDLKFSFCYLRVLGKQPNSVVKTSLALSQSAQRQKPSHSSSPRTPDTNHVTRAQ